LEITKKIVHAEEDEEEARHLVACHVYELASDRCQLGVTKLSDQFLTFSSSTDLIDGT
jgi:hypothetical protein